MFQHTVKPGSYTWKYHRPPPRRPPPRRSNFVDMDTLNDVFEQLIGEDDIFNAEDFCDEDLMPMDMALLLMLLDLGSGDSSSDEENYFY